MESVVRGIRDTDPPNGIAGPYHVMPTMELSAFATGMQSPLVAERVVETNLLREERHPDFSYVGADCYSEMAVLGK
jgi:hypothetical protein